MITRTLKTIVAFLAASSLLMATTPTQSIFDQLYQDGVVDITIETDLAKLIDERRAESHLPALITFEGAGGRKQVHEAKVKARGKFRRRVCEFPPVMLNFSKSRLLEKGIFPEYDKLKLVTHCIDDKFEGEENVLKEFLAYKLYSELTSQSYRVQLVKVTYKDTEKNLGRIKRYGFIIEDTDEMAHRLGGLECEDCRNLQPGEVAAGPTKLMGVFQYMIGNTDWNISMMRNLKFVKPYDGGAAVPVPYDFDFAGLVNAPYAIPRSDIGQLSIKQRVYQGQPMEEEALKAILRQFVDKKDRLLDVIYNFKPLNYEAKDKIVTYLNTFFQDAELLLEGKAPRDPQLIQALKEKEPKTEEADSSVGK